MITLRRLSECLFLWGDCWQQEGLLLFDSWQVSSLFFRLSNIKQAGFWWWNWNMINKHLRQMNDLRPRPADILHMTLITKDVWNPSVLLHFTRKVNVNLNLWSSVLQKQDFLKTTSFVSRGGVGLSPLSDCGGVTVRQLALAASVWDHCPLPVLTNKTR